MGTAIAKAAVRPRVITVAAVAAPYLIALWFGAWSLRGLDSGTPVDTDAARHAMNGVFIHDMLWHCHPLHLLEFAKSYYTRYPSLSMPYHPPVFPLFEALFLFAFGVHYLSARLAVAAATALAAWLLYRLVLKTHGSAPLAAAVTVLVFSLSSSLVLASDVMLEMPALVLILATMFQVPRPNEEWDTRRLMRFALLAAAAVWTKQNTVFLGLVPFAQVLLERRWRTLRSPALWIWSAVFGVFVVMLASLAALLGVAGNRSWPPFRPIPILSHNVPYYVDVLRQEFGIAGLILIAVSLVAALAGLAARGNSRNTLYVAWIGCDLMVAFLMPPYDYRYVFFAYPALAVLVCQTLAGAARRLVPPRLAWAAPALLAAGWFATHITTRPAFLHGPAETARLVAQSHPERILYCGRSNGNFVFALRALDPELKASTIRGDKLPRAVFQPAALERFAHDYGIDYIVLERSSIPRPWDGLVPGSPAYRFVDSVPLASSDQWMNGSLQVYRFLNPSSKPESTLRLRALGLTFDAGLPPERDAPE